MVSIAGIILGGIISLGIYEKEVASVDISFRNQFLFSLFLLDSSPENRNTLDIFLPSSDSKIYTGFSIRRSRINFKGHYLTKNLKYKIQLTLEGSSMSLRDFYTDYSPSDIIKIRVGQYKVPFSREYINSSGKLEFVDRSVVNSYFYLGRDIGITLTAGPKIAKINLGVFTGWGKNFKEIDEKSLSKNFLYVGRIEITPFGKTVYEQPNLKRQKILNFGLAGFFFPISDEEIQLKKIENRKDKSEILKEVQRRAQKENLWGVSADTKLWWNGFSFELEGHFSSPYNTDVFGLRVQPSYMITDSLGLGVRFSSVLWEGKSPTYEPGIALSYYFKDHTKLQLDYVNLKGPEDRFSYIRAQFQIYIK